MDFKNARSGPDPSRWMRLRVLILGGAFLLLLTGVFARAVWLQVVQRDRLRGMAQVQYVRALELPARRGDIFDRRGVPLAQSVDVDSIWIDPSMLEDVRAASAQLAKVLHLDRAELSERLSRAKRFAWVKRQVRPEEVAAVKALELPGLGFTKEPKRFYPQRELASQVMGVVGTDGQGLEGLELAFDDELTGQKEHIDGLRDAKGRKLMVEGDSSSFERQGASLRLTLDRQIQYVTEKALAKAIDDSKALDGVAVVMDPRTGEILAIANAPRFNPNAPEQVPVQRLRNRAALDSFEPGSTMKSFVIGTALDQHAIRTDQTFFCENGSWKIGRRTIHDTHKHGDLTPGEILRVSSNIGAAKVANVLGRDKLQQLFQKFGFGERTGLSLPGEAKGQLPYPKADIQLATQAFGQGMSATAVQIAAAYSAIANGGVLMRPYLISKVVDPDGVVLLENGPTQVRRVLSESTAKTLITMLEGVVAQKEGSTAPRARMDAYQVAGKTGTAQKVDPLTHGYSEKRIVSFAGMVPAEDPRLVILVVVDEPTVAVYGGHDGGSIAAPAFKEIASFALPYLGVPPSHPVSPALAVAEKPQKAVPPVEEPIVDAITEEPGEGEVVVPNLSGKVGREAVAKLLSVALEPRLLGSGRVISQTPPAGAHVEKGAQIVLELAAQP